MAEINEKRKKTFKPYHIRNGMSGISDNRSAAGEIPRDGFSGGQSDIRRQAKPENPLALFSGLRIPVIVVVVRVAAMPPPENLEIWVFR